MTEQELDALDSWLAREVMGWKPAQEVKEIEGEPYCEGEWVYFKDGEWWSAGYADNPWTSLSVWCPTRDLAQAGLALDAAGLALSLVYRPWGEDGATAEVSGRKKSGNATAETPALAICLALKATRA